MLRNMPPDADRLSEALVIWIGFREVPTPEVSEARLEQRFGAAEAIRLLPYLRSLLTEFYDNDVSRFTREPDEMADMAAAPFAERHPELSDEAIEALAWSYKHDFS